ncbi:MAG: twin-arginine translocase subunit TatC [Caldimicrobium sp.]
MNPSTLIISTKKAFIFLKKTGLFILPLALILYLILFFLSPEILLYLQKKYQQKLVFFTPTEPILSLLKFSFTLFILFTFPLIYLGLLTIFNSLLFLKKKFLLLLYFMGLLFFYSGVAFSYFITLPYGIKFLISFKTESLEPAISLSHFVNFFSFFLLTFGFIFELPLFLSILTLIGIIHPTKLGKFRKEIFFFIVVISAIITPTPDAINMSLLALPIYLLFELGLILGKLLKGTNILLEDNLKAPQPK